MMTGLPGFLVIGVLVLGLLAIIVVNLSNQPAHREIPIDSDAHAEPEYERGDADRVRDVSDRSDLLPLGWGMIAIGAIAALWAWFFMDITPAEYSETVNIDAVSQRAMLHIAGLVTVAIGAVCACAGHVVNEVRRGR